VLAVALVAIGYALTLGDPAPVPTPASSPFATVVPTWHGPTPVDVRGLLADGATYTPRVFLSGTISAGVATAPDGTVQVVLDTAGGSATELRRLAPADHAQVNGFAVGGDTLVWMETVARTGAAPVTTLWRTTWKSAAKPVSVTTNTGAVNFFGLQSDVVVQDGKAYWTAVGPGAATTEVRSVPLTGGTVTTRRLTGEYAMSGWPWVVSVTGGKGNPVLLHDLNTDTVVTVTTAATELPVCGPTWCRVSVTNESGLVGIDVMHPDGSARRRIAGPEATPTIADATLLDRYVPLITDRGAGRIGLSLFDLTTANTDLVAIEVANVQGRDGVLWWSTGVGSALVWHAVDLRAIS
jgi:hypothetical protein